METTTNRGAIGILKHNIYIPIYSQVYIMAQLLQKKQDIKKLFSSPTLQTVMMVEETIKKYNGTYNKTQLWDKLPRKVTWGTYNIILNYLEEINKIGIAKKNILVYIWNPKIIKKYLEMEGVDYERKFGY